MKMNRRLLIIPGSIIVMLLILVACQSEGAKSTETVNMPEIEVQVDEPTVEYITSSEDSSIIWSEDFEDGDLDAWEVFYQGNFIVDNGVLSSRAEGDIYHLSDVLFGTWSFDLYIDSTPGLLREVQFTEGGTNYQMISIRNSPNTQIWISTQMDPNEPESSFIDFGKILTGWHHFEVTRDESRWIKVYMDGQFQIEHFDDRAFDVESLVVYTCCSGPVIDNLIVRDQVIEISSEN